MEEQHGAQFKYNGHPTHPARVALGALIIKELLKCGDERTVRHVSENPYLQHFIGMKEYSDACPFGESTMVAFRMRFGPEEIAAILELSIPTPGPPDDDGGDEPPNDGTLLMDATCCPSDIAYPQDINLLSEAWEKLEHTIDDIENLVHHRAQSHLVRLLRPLFLEVSGKYRVAHLAVGRGVNGIDGDHIQYAADIPGAALVTGFASNTFSAFSRTVRELCIPARSWTILARQKTLLSGARMHRSLNRLLTSTPATGRGMSFMGTPPFSGTGSFDPQSQQARS